MKESKMKEKTDTEERSDEKSTEWKSNLKVMKVEACQAEPETWKLQLHL